MSKPMRFISYHVRYFGWPSVLGIVLIAGALLYGFTVLLPTIRHTHDLEHRVTLLQQEMQHHRGQWMDDSPQASLSTFYRFLPAEQEVIQEVGTVMAAAAEHGLDPDKIEYALARDPDAGFTSYQITLPVSGHYRDIRRFAAAVLNEIPSAALNEISFKRDNTSSADVESRLRFTLYLKRPA